MNWNIIRGWCVLGLCSLGLTHAQTLPSCEQLLEHLSSSFSVAHSVTSTVNIRSGVVEIAYNRSRFDRHDGELKVTLLERRGRRTPYDQDVFVDEPPEDNSLADSQSQADDVPLPFDCVAHDLTTQPHDNPNHDNPNHDNQSAPRYVLSLDNLQSDIPVDYWQLEFQRAGNWYLLERLFAPFNITILNIPVRGHFTMAFDSWDIPGRLPLSPRERVN